MKQVIEGRARSGRALASGDRRRDQLAGELSAVGPQGRDRDGPERPPPVQGNHQPLRLLPDRSGRAQQDARDGRQALRRAARPRSRPLDVPRRLRRRHRDRRDGFRRLDLHAGPAFRLRRDDAARRRSTRASAARTASTTRDTRTWSGPSTSPTSCSATRPCSTRCPSGSSGRAGRNRQGGPDRRQGTVRTVREPFARGVPTRPGAAGRGSHAGREGQGAYRRAGRRESDERRKLNLGHTFAHAIEKCAATSCTARPSRSARS